MLNVLLGISPHIIVYSAFIGLILLIHNYFSNFPPGGFQ